jgi:hypothetical protein
MLLVPNYWVRMATFALMGFLMLKNQVCYIWMFQLVHSKDKSAVCSVVNAFDTLTMCITCIYFEWVSKHWFWLYFGMTALGTASYVLIMLFIPEAPKWLLINNKKSQAI